VLSKLMSKKVRPSSTKIEKVLIKRGVKAIPRKSGGIVPDFLNLSKYRSALFGFRGKRENSHPTT
jgi:hypothetical protein